MFFIPLEFIFEYHVHPNPLYERPPKRDPTSGQSTAVNSCYFAYAAIAPFPLAQDMEPKDLHLFRSMPITLDQMQDMWSDAASKLTQHRHLLGRSESQRLPSLNGEDTAALALKQQAAERMTPIPKPPATCTVIGRRQIEQRLRQVQCYLSKLGYNYTGVPYFFEIKKRWSLRLLMETAKKMMAFALPIKCLEAVVVGLYLTHGLRGVHRFTLIFHSCAEGHVYKHIVLGIHHEGRFGAIGLSRRQDLMDKPLRFANLAALVEDYQLAYARNGHSLVRCYLGLPVLHDVTSSDPIVWRSTCFEFSAMSKKEIADGMATFQRKHFSQ